MQMIFSVKMVVIMYVREPNDTMAPLYWTGTFFSYSRTVTKKLEENWNRKQQYVQVIREKIILLSLKNLLYDILLCSASCFASGFSIAPSSSLCYSSLHDRLMLFGMKNRQRRPETPMKTTKQKKL